MESLTHVKNVKITLNIFSVYFVTMVTKKPKKKGKKMSIFQGSHPFSFGPDILSYHMSHWLRSK